MSFDAHLALEALSRAQAAVSHSDLSVALRLLTEALGMARYCLFDLTGALGGTVAAVYHDAPPSLASEVSDLGRAHDDPVVQMARVRPYVPFVWGPGPALYADSFYERHASAGYRSGIVANYADQGDSTAVLVLTSTATGMDDDLAVTAMGHCTRMAHAVLPALSRLRPALPSSPLTERERECLLHALCGLTIKASGHRLGIGAGSVAEYLRRARAKVGATSSLAAGISAIQRGWLDVGQLNALSGELDAVGR